MSSTLTRHVLLTLIPPFLRTMIEADLSYLTVLENIKLADDFFCMTLKTAHNCSHLKPGQFLNIYLPCEDRILPRPFSIFDADNFSLKVLYKVVGRGTLLFSKSIPGDSLKVLYPLGNAFPWHPEASIAFLAGGVGIAPVYFYLSRLQKELKGASLKTVFYGAQNSSQLILTKGLSDLAKTVFSTDDGSTGFKGNCVEAFRQECLRDNKKPDYLMACGPKKMLQAAARVASELKIEAFLSLEEIMGCGFGACVGCAVKKNQPETEYALVCKDGPVFEAKEIDLS